MRYLVRVDGSVECRTAREAAEVSRLMRAGGPVAGDPVPFVKVEVGEPDPGRVVEAFRRSLVRAKGAPPPADVAPGTLSEEFITRTTTWKAPSPPERAKPGLPPAPEPAGAAWSPSVVDPRAFERAVRAFERAVTGAAEDDDKRPPGAPHLSVALHEARLLQSELRKPLEVDPKAFERAVAGAAEEVAARVEGAVAYGLDPKNAGKPERVVVGDPELKELLGEGPLLEVPVEVMQAVQKAALVRDFREMSATEPAPIVYEPGKPLPDVATKDPRPRCIECKKRWAPEPGVDAACTPCPVCAGRTGEEKPIRVVGGTLGDDARREFETRERVCEACLRKGGDKSMGKSFKASREGCARCGQPTIDGHMVRKREFRTRPA